MMIFIVLYWRAGRRLALGAVCCACACAFCACASSAAKRQSPPVPVSVPLLLGKLSLEDWKKNAGWSSYRTEYAPLPAFAQRIEEDWLKLNISFVVFAGTWCDDSQRELPRLFRLLETSNVPSSRIAIYGMDENKNDITGTAERYGVYKIPTLIVFKNGQEHGRIIEQPRTSWDLDLIVVMER